MDGSATPTKIGIAGHRRQSLEAFFMTAYFAMIRSYSSSMYIKASKPVSNDRVWGDLNVKALLPRGFFRYGHQDHGAGPSVRQHTIVD